MQAVKDGKTLSKSDTNITDADRTRYASMPGDPAASYTSSGSGTQSSSSNNYSYSDSNDYSYSGGSDNSGYEEPSVPPNPPAAKRRLNLRAVTRHRLGLPAAKRFPPNPPAATRHPQSQIPAQTAAKQSQSLRLK